MKKAIFLQTQSLISGSLSQHKPIGFCSLCIDNVKITIDAYNGLGATAEPRVDSLVEVVDQNEVFEMTPTQLVKAIRYYCENASEWQEIVRYRNKNHHIIPDAVKPVKKG